MLLLGGGLSGLADTIGGEFDELPPITLDLFTRLVALEAMTGDFTLQLNCFGIELEGEMALKGAKEVRFAVRPLECFGRKGVEIYSGMVGVAGSSVI